MPAPTTCIAAAFTAFAKFYGVDLKRVPPKSRPATRHKITIRDGTRTRAARKDSAVHVSLSSDSPIKQPGASHPLPGRTRELAKQLPPTQVGDKSPESEELRRHAIPPSGGAPCVGYICSTAGYCQPRIVEFFIGLSFREGREEPPGPAGACHWARQKRDPVGRGPIINLKRIARRIGG
jgi:hypothetical protein